MAKIHITHGPDGKILASSESKNLPRPMNVEGVKVGEFEVPAKFAGKKMHEYIRHLRVDVATHRLTEK